MHFNLSITAGEDYVAVDEVVVFGPDDTQLCVNVTILEDEAVESVESFSITARTADPDITFLFGVALINIEDDNDSTFSVTVPSIKDAYFLAFTWAFHSIHSSG